MCMTLAVARCNTWGAF